MGRSRTPQASSSVEPTTINAQSLKKRKIAGMLHFFKRAPADKATAKLQSALGALVTSVEHEICYNVELSAELDGEAERRLLWLLAETFEPAATARESFLGASDVLEVGPRLSFSTAWCSNALSICAACGLTQVARVEQSRRYKLTTASPLSAAQRAAALASLHDRMTEAVYEAPLATFGVDGATAAPTRTIPLAAEGRDALVRISAELGLGFDDADVEMYTALFTEKLQRDPTDVEIFDMAQSNSEHSRHWYFGGKQVIAGELQEKTLFQMVKATLQAPTVNKSNSVIAFHDNSSAIAGFPCAPLRPSDALGPAPLAPTADTYHLILTAETHNFPTGVAPFAGAETGTGGRIRDVHATGRGALVVAGVSSYCVGALRIPGYELPWEEAMEYPPNLASPLQILVEGSNGASDYGNKFGEPVICGFARSFGLTLPSGERREWVKPIMFSAGLGQMSAAHADKGAPEPGMWVVKLGGPAYRIGVGGGAASSRVGDAASAALDFDAVQRGDAEMENKMNRVIRACVELGKDNPIVSIHDQGAGGNGNVLKEICEPLGATLQVRDILSADPTLSVLELWGAEYQENCALLLRDESEGLFKAICARENCPCAFLGKVSGDGRLRLEDAADGSCPVDLPLELVLGDMPKKTFTSAAADLSAAAKPLALPADATLASALDRVLRLPSVGSKRFLTNKVDRSVSGLIAQQQCVGPLHTPLADVGVIAQAHGGVTGGATAVGEQPIKGLLSPAAMARLTVAEALTNLVWAPITALGDVKCSANWMWAAKLEGEGAAMYEACSAMAAVMAEVGVAVDGGKDSLSMAARVGDTTVKAPGALVVTVYAMVPDVTLVLTPDLKGDDSVLLHLDVANGRRRLGGSALAHVYGQLGDTTPDLDDPKALVAAFDAVQALAKRGALLSGHDVSDGGLLVALLEMAFAGDKGIEIDLAYVETGGLPGAVGSVGVMEAAFAEEVGMVVEVAKADADAVAAELRAAGVAVAVVGRSTGAAKEVVVNHVLKAGQGAVKEVLRSPLASLRDVWEATGFELEKRQCAPACVAQEQAGLATRRAPDWTLTFNPLPTAAALVAAPADARTAVAVLRQEGSNGDREMCAALHAGGLQPWDVAMSDLLAGKIDLDRFGGVVFVGGFSYADVLDSAKGWAATIRYNERLWAMFEAFRTRKTTFSLGVCNGCQLMALLGWVPGGEADGAPLPAEEQPRFVHNASGRFESRFSSVKVGPSPAVLLKGMEGSSLGVWVAHGEGRAHFPTPSHFERVKAKQLAPLRYVDDSCETTSAYPFNPNGSPEGIAGLCSEDGRHLAMMPHPERCFMKWQWPWAPPAWKDHAAAPWLKLFQNAQAFAQPEEEK